jgi:peptidoglycan/LPS O-acetylase OafA/YrhL
MWMDEKVNIREIQQKIHRDSMRDGVTEMLLGVLLLSSSLLYGNPGFTVLYVFTMILINKAMHHIKERYIHPRTGYVELKREDPKRTMGGILLFFFAVGLLMYLVLYVAEGALPSSDTLYRWTPTFLGLMFLGAMTYLREKKGSTGVLAWAGYAIAVGLVFSLYGFASPKDGMTLYMLLMGISFLLVGFYKFRSFLATHPVIQEIDEEQPVEAGETT